MEERATAADRAALLIAVPGATVAFGLGFNLGAFDEIFFDAILAVWVIATLVLAASFFTRLPPRHWAGRAVLLLPTLWLVMASLIDPIETSALDNAVFAVTIVITVITLPFIGWILISAINPDFVSLPRHNRAAVMTAVAVFAVAGWLLGARNDAFLTCDDFKVSGNDLPANCVPGPKTIDQ